MTGGSTNPLVLLFVVVGVVCTICAWPILAFMYAVVVGLFKTF